MALTKLTCPHCKSVLTPPKPVPQGAKLKCPKCKKGFTAGQDDPDDNDLLIRMDEDEDDAPRKGGGIAEQPGSPADKKKKAVDEIDVIDVLADDEAPVKKKETARKGSPEKPDKKEQKAEKKPDKQKNKLDAGEEDNEPGATYGVAAGEDDHEEEDDSPRGKKGGGKKKKKKEEVSYIPDDTPKDPRGAAQEKVIVCSNYMLGSAIAGFFGYLALIIIIMIPAATPLVRDQGTKDSPVEILQLPGNSLSVAGQTEQQSNAPAEKEVKEKPSIFTVFDVDMGQFSSFGLGYFILILLPLILGMAYSATIAYGSVQTQSLESRPWGITGSVMTMLSYQIVGLALVTCWAVEILLIGVLDTDKESARYTQVGLLVLFVVSEIIVGAIVLITLLQEDVLAGFEYKPE